MSFFHEPEWAEAIAKKIDALAGAIAQSNTKFQQELVAIQNQLAAQEALIQKLLNAVAPWLPSRLAIHITGDKNMNLKAGIDFQLKDDGTATATLTLVDAAGLPAQLPSGSTLSVPVWVASSPAIVVTVAADGMSAKIAPATPPVLATDVTITAGPATQTNADGTTATIAAVTSEGIDVVGDVASGFSIAIS